MHTPSRTKPLTEAHNPQSGQFSEKRMVEHLDELGIDLEGFDLSGIDPIPTEAERNYGLYDAERELELRLDEPKRGWF